MYLLNVRDGSIRWRLDVLHDNASRDASSEFIATPTPSAASTKPVPISSSPAVLQQTLEQHRSDSIPSVASSNMCVRVAVANQRGCIALLQLCFLGAANPEATVLSRLHLPLGADVFSSPVCVDGEMWIGARNNMLYGLQLQ